MAGQCERPTVAFLTANIHIGSGRALWPGVADAADAQGVNLFCLPGGGLGVYEAFESQRNVVYDLVGPANVDAVVSWSSTVGGALDAAEVVRFHRRFEPLPLVTLAQLAEGVPAVTVDSYHGMHAAIAHLIEAHGFRRLALIRGPERHFYAEERRCAYIDALRGFGIPYDARLVTGPMPWGAGAEAVRILLDERKLRPGIDIEAVVAVSDLLALDALRALQARGVAVPGEVAIVGFNDSVEGRFTTPPLTSVALPFYDQGAEAVRLALARLAGEAAPEHAVLQSRLVVRQSCGCPSQGVALAGAGLAQVAPGGLEAGYAALGEALAAAVAEAAGDARRSAAWATRLLGALRFELEGEARGRLFLPAIESILQQAGGADLTAWQGVISTMRRHLLPYLGEGARLRAEGLFGQARVLIGEMALRAQAYQELQATRQAELLREAVQALITAFDVERLADVLAERLPRLGVASAYLALYERPDVPLEGARLVLAYTEKGRVALGPSGRRFPSQQLVPKDLLPGRRHSYVVEPLFFGEEQLGFALFEIGPRDGSFYEALRGHISSALKGALLFSEAQEARLAAEKADRVKTRLLANVSHELRTPLHIILGHTQGALSSPQPYGLTPPPALIDDLQHIQRSAEHQLRVINDLLDLSRAEIDELDLYLELLDPRPLLEDAFQSMAGRADSRPGVAWRLQLPDRLPVVRADRVRLRQVLLNLLSNAAKFTERGHIVLGAEVSPPHLHLWVEDTGCGISADDQERIFEPFVTAEHGCGCMAGIGLGLTITRRLVALHGGSMALVSEPGRGSTFHVYLPLPSLSERGAGPAASGEPVLLLISASGEPTPEVVELSERRGLAIRRLQAADDLEGALAQMAPAALAWDLAGATPRDWVLVRRLRNHPRLSQVPFLLYGQGPEAGPAKAAGLTSVVAKPVGGQTLLQAIEASRPSQTQGPILIVDDDPQACARHQQIVAEGLPGYAVRTASHGAEALAIMAEEVPSLVVLDLMMPGMDGFELLDRMRADERTRRVPVVVLSSKVLGLDDILRLEQHAHVTLQSKGVLSESETVAALNRALFGTDCLPPHTSALVKRALTYLHQNYARPLARWEIAETVGVSEDYLSRVFGRELGLTPWEYLNRYRVVRAKTLLRSSNESIKAIARQVGFKDHAYFSRVFRKLVGVPPAAYREHPEA